jgi:hypothetical protein
MFYVKTKGQSTLEYVILLGFVIAALIAMGFYMKRGFQGRLRESTDQVGEQYEAGKTTGKYTVTSNMKQNEVLGSGGHITTNIQTNEQKKSGFEKVTMNLL